MDLGRLRKARSEASAWDFGGVSTPPGFARQRAKVSRRARRRTGQWKAITGSNGNDSIPFTGGAGFKGNLLINGGNGGDSVTVTGPSPGLLECSVVWAM